MFWGHAVENGKAPRYRAFISYSHRDAAFGRRLHRKLETYAVPRKLVGRQTDRGPIPARITPIFRDREELSAAGNLSDEVQAALRESGALIVVCSPSAAASPWVSREIELFRALHPDRPILAALLHGDPDEAFPEPLRRPGPDGLPVEPLAADFRKDGDGFRLALVKLTAGVIGARLDELIQRDAQRRLRTVTLITVASLAAMLAMGLLMILALQARAEADRQRAEAEGLVEFMLTDLRDRLKDVAGRVTILSAVNERALKYYKDQDLAELPPHSLEQRARLLHAMAEDDLTRGDGAAALAKVREARRVTAALLAADPENHERMWAHSQSEFWAGYLSYGQGKLDDAATAFGVYSDLSEKLVRAEPSNGDYLREAAYAEGSRCSLEQEKGRDIQIALVACRAALSRMERAIRVTGRDKRAIEDLANRHGWLADALRASGDPAGALQHRVLQEDLLAEGLRGSPASMTLKEAWIANQRALAVLEAQQGRRTEALARLRRALADLEPMIAHDRDNQVWRRQKDKIDKQIGALSIQ